MRITDKILHNNFIYNLAYASERLYDAENKVLTNKRLNKPSDSPVDVMTDLAIRTKLDEIDQYRRNIARSQTLLQNTESIVTQLQDIFQRLNTLTIQGASDSYGPTDKISISYEVNQLLEQIYTFANNRSESTYTFSGTYSDTAPYVAVRNNNGEITAVKSAGSTGDINSLIGENIQIKVNVNGQDMFEAGENLFDVVLDIRDNLRANNTDGLKNDIGRLQEASEKIINFQAVIGSRLNRITAADSRAESDTISFTEFLSNTEDIDASEAIMDYQLQLLTLQSSLQAGSRLIQPKLSDFLR